MEQGNSSTDFFNTAIAGLALIVSFFTLYLQRRDRKPRLRVEFERSYFPNPSGEYPRGTIAHPTPSLTIRLRNPTERAIKIQQTCFVDGKKRTFVLPSNWKTVDRIPSHDHRAFSVSVPEFEKCSKEVKMVRPEKGKFVLVDGTGKEHKSLSLGDALSMEPSMLP